MTAATHTSESEFDLAVVGAGAAGQVAAIAAARTGQRVVLVEQMPKCGMKLLATGGGRANLTRMLSDREIQTAFGRQGRFIGPALEHLGPHALREFFATLGVDTVADETGRVYPETHKATTVQHALTRQLERLGVDVRCRCGATSLWIDDGQLRGLHTEAGAIAAGRVLLACGGKSWPTLGGTGGGYALAQQAGHTITPLLPGLAGLVSKEQWLVKLAGVALRDARLWIALPKQSKAGLTGDVLFTHRGLSGPAAIDLSGDIAQLLPRHNPVPVQMELVAGKGVAHWAEAMDAWRRDDGKKQVAKLLRQQGQLPASLVKVLFSQAQLDDQLTAAQLPGAGKTKLANLLGRLEIPVTRTEGFDSAFVTRGGVKLKEVDPHTLESRLLPGLSLAGELLDLDAPTGGLNLQWAFASGHLAATAI